MKLYYAPGACSLSCHIALRETERTFELERVDIKTKKTASNADYWKINPKGYVPTLELDDGQRLTENAAILQYLADQRPDYGLVPPAESFARVRLWEHLNYVAAEVHPAFRPFFAQSSDEAKQAARDKIRTRLGLYEALFASGSPFVLGERMSVADIYLFVIANWTRSLGIQLEGVPKVSDFLDRMSKRETVRQAMKAEGLI